MRIDIFFLVSAYLHSFITYYTNYYRIMDILNKKLHTVQNQQNDIENKFIGYSFFYNHNKKYLYFYYFIF